MYIHTDTIYIYLYLSRIYANSHSFSPPVFQFPQKLPIFSEAILDKIAVALGGRAAEELFVEKITTGASDDLDKAQRPR